MPGGSKELDEVHIREIFDMSLFDSETKQIKMPFREDEEIWIVKAIEKFGLTNDLHTAVNHMCPFLTYETIQKTCKRLANEVKKKECSSFMYVFFLFKIYSD